MAIDNCLRLPSHTLVGHEISFSRYRCMKCVRARTRNRERDARSRGIPLVWDFEWLLPTTSYFMSINAEVVCLGERTIWKGPQFSIKDVIHYYLDSFVAIIGVTIHGEFWQICIHLISKLFAKFLSPRPYDQTIILKLINNKYHYERTSEIVFQPLWKQYARVIQCK